MSRKCSPAPCFKLRLTLFPRRPSGMLARSGSYNVRSRVIDDDKTVYGGHLSLVLLRASLISSFTSQSTLSGLSPSRRSGDCFDAGTNSEGSRNMFCNQSRNDGHFSFFMALTELLRVRRSLHWPSRQERVQGPPMKSVPMRE